MSSTSMFTGLCLILLPVVGGIPFSSIGLGIGKASQQGVFGTAVVLGNGNFASFGAGASDDIVSGSTSVISSKADTSISEPSPAESPDNVSDFEILPLLGRPLQAAVPDYRDTSASPGKTHTSGDSMNKKTESNESVSSDYSEEGDAPKVCWIMSKRCCYEEVQRGYECKDYYSHRYSRCHPVIAYERVCGEIKERPAHHPAPKGRVKYEETVLKNYDARYGPHVAGYPNSGESEYYRTDGIPTKPHGVSGTAFTAPEAYEYGGEDKTSDGFEAEGNEESMVSIVPYQETNGSQISKAGEAAAEETQATEFKEENKGTIPAGAVGSNEEKPQPYQNQGKTFESTSDEYQEEGGPVGSDPAQATYDTGAANGGNGPSYRIVQN